MASFYNIAAQSSVKVSPYAQPDKGEVIDTLSGKIDEDGMVQDNNGDTEGALRFYSNNNFRLPVSLMNDNVTINYRNLFNGYAENDQNFTDYNDYKKCISTNNLYKQYLKDKHDPTYSNIMKYYNGTGDLAKYKIQDFIYLKYYNQIPNNHMITLRRYLMPCNDRMFSLDTTQSLMNTENGYEEEYFAIATAVTYLGEKAGNKLSDILKISYGARYEDKTAQIEELRNSDGGFAEQFKQWGGNENLLKGKGDLNTSNFASGAALNVLAAAKGTTMSDVIRRANAFDGNEFIARYGEEFYGDLNVIDKVKMRSRGLEFTHSFSIVFEYSLKSLKCVNPRVAMIDILSNFTLLTGNYGEFWGGATIFYGTNSIAPQFGNPEYLRKGEYGKYINSLWNDVRTGFEHIQGNGNVLSGIMNIIGLGLGGVLTTLLGSIFGGKVGVPGTAQAPRALLSGEPTGYWHLTIGNPLDPIAMIGNLCVTNTTVELNDILGYDDFPTEIKFTVDFEHGRPRDNAFIQSMFNAGKGRTYTFCNSDIENAYGSIDSMRNFQKYNDEQNNQSLNELYDSNGIPSEGFKNISSSPVSTKNKMKIIGGILNE